MMASDHRRRGISRVLAKLDASVEAGNYYEAHQMYRSLYFRFISQQKYVECLDILYQGATTLLNKKQYCSGADIALLIIDTLEQIDDTALKLWTPRLGFILKQISPTTVERETIIIRSIKWSAEKSGFPLGYPDMHKVIAELLWSEDNTGPARHHYLLSKDGVACGNMLIELSENKGYPSEIDLFIAQTVLQLLCLKDPDTALSAFNTYTSRHPRIGLTKPSYGLPLLNFLFMLLKIIGTGRLTTFQKLCVLYKPSTDRDPAYGKYLQKIGVLHFGVVPPPEHQPGVMRGIVGGNVGGLFSGIFNRLFHGLDDEAGEEDDDDEEEDDEEEEPRPPRRNNRINNVNMTELD